METISTVIESLLRYGVLKEGLFLKVKGGESVAELRRRLVSEEQAAYDSPLLKDDPYLTASLLLQLLLALEEPLLYAIHQPLTSATCKLHPQMSNHSVGSLKPIRGDDQVSMFADWFRSLKACMTSFRL